MPRIGPLLETERCLDGVHLVDGFFRPRSERREPVRVVSADLNNLIVLDFVNTRDDLAPFLSRYSTGSIFDSRDWQGPPSWGDDKIAKISREGVHEKDPPRPPPDRDEPYAHWEMVWMAQWTLREILVAVSGPDPLKAVAYLDAQPSIYLKASFNLQDGKPQTLLRCAHLLEFMKMEVAMIALEGAKVVTCEHCKNFFLTGPGTSRRIHATHCSDRCRVAAMRARKKGSE